MSYYNQAKKFKCENCHKAAISLDHSVNLCQTCRPKKIGRCESCGKKFESTTGKTKCRLCRRLHNEISEFSIKRNLNQMQANLCNELQPYANDIRLLNAKLKWDLLTPLDYFRVADLYVKITCDEMKYSAQDPDVQIKLMLHDLYQLLVNDKFKIKSEKGKKAIIQLDKEGKVIAKWSSVKACAKDLYLDRASVRAYCNGKRRSKFFILRWRY